MMGVKRERERESSDQHIAKMIIYLSGNISSSSCNFLFGTYYNV
jgi:hypothetical protein